MEEIMVLEEADAKTWTSEITQAVNDISVATHKLDIGFEECSTKSIESG